MVFLCEDNLSSGFIDNILSSGFIDFLDEYMDELDAPESTSGNQTAAGEGQLT